MTDATVIGGGVSGLTAAYRLVQAGRRVTIVEPAEIGGVVRTLKQSGFTLECGPNVFLEKPEFSALIDELDLRGEVTYPSIEPYEQLVWFRGRPTPVPKTFPAFVRSPLIPTLHKLAIPLRLLRRGVMAPKVEDESVAEFFGRLAGARVVRDVLDPVLKGIYGGDAEDLSARSIFPKLWDAMTNGLSVKEYLKASKRAAKPKLCVLRSGASTLPSRLWERTAPFSEHVRDEVQRIGRLGNRFTLQLAGGSSILADEVVIATSGPVSGSMLKDLCPDLSKKLCAIDYATLVVVHSEVDESVSLPRDAFGVLFPGRRESRLLGVMFNSALFPHTAPPGRKLLTLCFGGVRCGEICDLPDSRFEELATEELASTLRIGNARMMAVTRWRRAVPQFRVGHFRLLGAIEDAEREYPGMYFCGVDRGGVGVPDRVKWSVPGQNAENGRSAAP